MSGQTRSEDSLARKTKLSVDSNEELLCAWLAAGDRGDVDEFDPYLHPEVVVHAPLGFLASTTGVEAEKGVWADAKRAMPDIRHEVQEAVGSELTGRRSRGRHGER